MSSEECHLSKNFGNTSDLLRLVGRQGIAPKSLALSLRPFLFFFARQPTTTDLLARCVSSEQDSQDHTIAPA